MDAVMSGVERLMDAFRITPAPECAALVWVSSDSPVESTRSLFGAAVKEGPVARHEHVAKTSSFIRPLNRKKPQYSLCASNLNATVRESS